jgi:hypothetical protein
MPCSLELISLAYQSWYSIFLPQQINEQHFSVFLITTDWLLMLWNLWFRYSDLKCLNYLKKKLFEWSWQWLLQIVVSIYMKSRLRKVKGKPYIRARSESWCARTQIQMGRPQHNGATPTCCKTLLEDRPPQLGLGLLRWAMGENEKR